MKSWSEFSFLAFLYLMNTNYQKSDNVGMLIQYQIPQCDHLRMLNAGDIQVINEANFNCNERTD